MTLLDKLKNVLHLEVNHPEVKEFLILFQAELRLVTGNPSLDIVNPTINSQHYRYKWGSDEFKMSLADAPTASRLVHWLFYWPDNPGTTWSSVSTYVEDINLEYIQITTTEIKKKIKL